MTEDILVDVQSGVQTITLNRPQKRNSLTFAMYGAMAEAFQKGNADPSIRVALLRGSDNCFCAGNDVNDFLKGGGADESRRFMQALTSFSKPLVAEVDGLAIGIGVTALLHFDLIYASTRAYFQTPFVDLGLVPEFASSLLIPAIVGHRRASQFLLLCEKMSSQEACDLGIINQVCMPEQLADTVQNKLRYLTARPPSSIRITKQLLKRAQAEAIQQTIELESELFAKQLGSAEAKEALTAFTERRKPDFSKFG